ncbi:proline/glycine betaine ABC transporter permease [Pelagibacteraceae bacterium]|jgi:glycine betaine/proline transport system permease protein|nr:proline/glycine betaine ABC transporter permease [Pelagibacteraceae bacterium]MDC1302797.1 proline/glycine betaine ABC transporter permease [Pelagibacterales bacterium]|tara:strand:+ start:805 stop:1701 length:897 start_codon:yes stop_codon:yes gene_type:complete
MNIVEFFTTFPEMSKSGLRLFKKTVDGAYRSFSREYGDAIEAVFDPVLYFLVWFEKVLQNSPWPLVLMAFLSLIYFGSRSLSLTVGSFFAFLLIGYFGMWEDTMSTVSIIGVCTFISIGLGIPIGILMSGSDRARSAISPVLDIMQTLPSFVYLIPVVMLLGIGKIPGLLAVIIYAIPPIIRLTDLGIREVDKEVLEAADAFGANRRQKLFRVQLPLALPTIFAGINQTIMMALAMVVIASMIGVKGLGQPVLKAIANQYFTMGLLNGLAIVVLAIVFDRVSQSYGKRLQQHRAGSRE